MNAPGHFDFYTFVLFVHIASAVVAFGATFAYPVIELTLKRVDLRALPGWHEAQNHRRVMPIGMLSSLLVLTALLLMVWKPGA